MLTSPLIAKIDFLPETPPGGERAHVDFPHLSNSQLQALTRCGTAYMFARRLKIPEPLNTSTLKGSAFHEGTGDFFTLLRSGATFDDALAAAKKTALRYIKEELGYNAETKTCSEIVDFGQRWYKGPRDTPRSITLDVFAALEHVLSQPFVKSLSPLSIERGYVIHWADGKTLPLVGYTDLVYALENDAAILDWKSGGKLKGDYALGMDLAQVAYAYGAAQDLQKNVTTLTYGSLTWEAPSDGGEAADVVFLQQNIPFDPQRLERLYSRCVEATATIEAERWSLADSDFICPTCPFRVPCSDKFGKLDITVLDSADWATKREAEAALIVPVEKPKVAYGLQGPSEKQITWLQQLLQQCDMTLGEAMVAIKKKAVDTWAGVGKNDASALIEYLKPKAETAVLLRDQARRADRQIAQARAALSGLPDGAQADILATMGLASSHLITTPEQALTLLKHVSTAYWSK